MSVTPLPQTDQIPLHEWRFCSFVAPSALPESTFAAQFSSGGAVISHLSQTATDWGPGWTEYTCYVEAQYPTTPDRLKQYVSAQALVRLFPSLEPLFHLEGCQWQAGSIRSAFLPECNREFLLSPDWRR